MLARILWHPNVTQLRSFGRWMAGMLVVMTIVRWKIDLAAILTVAAALVLLFFAQFIPAALRPIHKVWMALAFVLGQTVGRLIIAGFFFLILTPIALFYRVLGRDSLRIRRGVEGSYWTSLPYEEAADARKDAYQNQF